MKKDSVEFFDIVNEADEIIGKIRENEQNTVKPSQLRFINIIVINNDNMIVVPKRSSNRKLFPNCYDFSVGGHVNSGENYEEAAYLANIIKPNMVIPIHYGSIIGTKEDAIMFSKLVSKDIECKIIL